MAKRNALGFASVLPTNTHYEIGLCRPSPFGTKLHKLPYAFLIEHLEGIVRMQLLFDVPGQESSAVVAT